MKTFAVILLVFFFGNTNSKSVEGKYYDYFGSKLKISSDSTFLYEWNFDLSSSWSKGKWRISNDTIYFSIIPVFDTLRIPNKKDTLLLSVDQKPELITDKNSSIIHFLSSGGQNRQEMSSKLFYKDDKLYEIGKRGKLITEKKKQFWINEKHETWFVKE
jgi:hypothetical protein